MNEAIVTKQLVDDDAAEMRRIEQRQADERELRLIGAQLWDRFRMLVNQRFPIVVVGMRCDAIVCDDAPIVRLKVSGTLNGDRVMRCRFLVDEVRIEALSSLVVSGIVSRVEGMFAEFSRRAAVLKFEQYKRSALPPGESANCAAEVAQKQAPGGG